MSLASDFSCRRMSGGRRALGVEALEARCLCAADLAAASIGMMEPAIDVVSPPAVADELALTAMPPAEDGWLAPDASVVVVGLDGWEVGLGDGGVDSGQGAWYESMACGFELVQDSGGELVEVPAPDADGFGGIDTIAVMSGVSTRSADTATAAPAWAAAWAAFSMTGRDASAAGPGEDGWRSRRVRARV